MTYGEVKATGAEILFDSYVGVPTDGWEEVSIDRLRSLSERAATQLQQPRTAREHAEAVTLQRSSAAAIQRAEAGNRVFTVEWDGERAFAATKRPST